MPLSVTDASPEECDEHRREEETFAPGQRLPPNRSSRWLAVAQHRLSRENGCWQPTSSVVP